MELSFVSNFILPKPLNKEETFTRSFLKQFQKIYDSIMGLFPAKAVPFSLNYQGYLIQLPRKLKIKFRHNSLNI